MRNGLRIEMSNEMRKIVSNNPNPSPTSVISPHKQSLELPIYQIKIKVNFLQVLKESNLISDFLPYMHPFVVHRTYNISSS